MISSRVVSAAGTAVEETLEAPAFDKEVKYDNDNDNNSNNNNVLDIAEEEELLPGGAVPRATEAAAEAMAGSVEKPLHEAISSFFEPELEQEQNSSQEYQGEEAQGASMSEVVDLSAATEADDFLQVFQRNKEEAMIEAETHAEVEAANAVLEEKGEEEKETIYHYVGVDGVEGGVEDGIEQSEVEAVFIISTFEEQEEQEEDVPVVTIVTTTTTTTSSTTTTTTDNAEYEPSVFTMMQATLDEEVQAVIMDEDVIVFSTDDGDDDAASTRLAMLTAGNGVSFRGDISRDELQLPEQRQVYAAHDDVLLEAEARPLSMSREGVASISWDGDGWPGYDDSGPRNGAGYFVVRSGGEDVLEIQGVSEYYPDSASDVKSLTLSGIEDMAASWDVDLSSSSATTTITTSDDPSFYSFRRGGPMFSSITFIFTDDQWPTPLYSARWMLSVDLVGLSICALSLTIVIIILFGLSEDKNEEKEEKEEEFDEEQGVSRFYSDATEDNQDKVERESLLSAPEPITAAAKSADTGVNLAKGADLAAAKIRSGYVEEPPVWTNPCATWKYR